MLRPRHLILFFGLVPTILAAAICVYRPAALTRLEYLVYDTLVVLARTHPPSGRVAIVDIDERSLAAVGQWPWRREVLGQLIARLQDLGAAAIALDIVFAESDRHEASADTGDAALARSLRAGRVVVGYALTFDEVPMAATACVQHPVGLALVRGSDGPVADPLFRATGAICSLPILTQAADASGFLNAAPDPDGRLRRAPVLIAFNERVYPSLALAAVAEATGIRDVTLRAVNANTSSLVLDSRRVPLDGKSNLLLRYRGAKRTFPYFSAVDVMSGRTPADDFRDKLVFVGTTALGTREVVATPLDTLFAGVEVQATVADNLLQQDFVYRPEHGVAVEAQVVLALGIAAALLVGRFGLGWGALGAASCLGAAWAGPVWLMSGNGAFVSPLFPTIGLVASVSAMTGGRFLIERRRADRAGEAKATSQRLMVQSLLSLTEARDAETGQHSRRTRQYTRVLAEQLALHPRFKAYLTPERVDLLASLAPLHDIGKVGVPDRILNKPGILTPEELEEMRSHPTHGRDAIVRAEEEAGVRDDEVLALAKDIVYTHHERWDGAGYPQGLRGADIPIAGRLVALVDVYDAAITRRLYRQPLSHDEAVAFIAAGSGTHFDPDVVDAFLEISPIWRSLSADDQRPPTDDQRPS
jgi:adenylate cyclase